MALVFTKTTFGSYPQFLAHGELLSPVIIVCVWILEILRCFQLFMRRAPVIIAPKHHSDGCVGTAKLHIASRL